jgi:enterobactin synthetase component D
MTPFQVAFRLDLAHGRCVGVTLPESAGPSTGGDDGDASIPQAMLAALPEAERRHVETLPPARRASWVGGRIALRAALSDLGCDAGPILATPRGAPRLPPRARGSISHKRRLAVGLAALVREPAPVAESAAWQIGIDLERVVAGHSGVAGYVLRPEERDRLPPPDDPARTEEILFAFSAKEAIYKAIDPFLGRYVSFREVAVARGPDGSALATLHLRRAPAPEIQPNFDVEIHWLRREDLILTPARVRRAQ